MFFILVIFLNIKSSVDISFSYNVSNPHNFNTSNNLNTIATELRKTYYFKNSYYSSFALSYSYSVLDYFNVLDDKNISFKFNTYDFIFELGKEFRNNIFSGAICLGHSTSSYYDVLEDAPFTRKDRGPTYAINLMLGRLIQNNKELKFGFIYKRLDQKYEYDFFGMMFLYRYRLNA